MNSFKKLSIMLTTFVFCSGMATTAFASCFNNSIDKYNNQERFKDLLHLMSTSHYNTPLTFPINENPIPVVLQNFSEKERQDAINAIKRLDDISENINYVILEKDDVKIYQKITITNNVDITSYFPDDETSLGITQYTIDNQKSIIKYPIDILIDERCNNVYDENGVSLTSYVIKHEMMHTLGFNDLYDEEYLNKSIMYYNVDSGLNDFSEFDEKNIKQLYDEYNVTVSYPTLLKYTTYKKEEDYSR